MKLDSGQTILITGASGGLGTYLARALSKFGVNQSLVAFPGKDLPPLKAEVEKAGIKAHYMVADLRVKEERDRVISETREKFGKIDVLINNAGIEYTAPYHELTEAEVASIISVNLEAPMMLARLVLPEMLERGSGHVVNMSSLAGKSGPAFQEPYAATKAALVAFTTSLRATYFGSGVGFSAICPGFVEAGIYQRIKESSGCSAPALLGTSPPEAVPKAVIRAIQKDLPQVIVNPYPVRPLFAATELFPSFGAWLTRVTGAHAFFKRVYEAQKKDADTAKETSTSTDAPKES